MKFSQLAFGAGTTLAAATATIGAAAAPPIVGTPFQLPGSLAAAWGCTTALLAWPDNTNLRVSRIDLATRRVLDPDGVVLSTNYYGGQPAIAFDGANYMVAWYDSRPASGSGNTGEGIYAARVRESDGTLVDGPSGFPVMTLFYYNYQNTNGNFVNFTSLLSTPAIAFAAGNFMVVAGAELGGAGSWYATGSRIRASDAQLLDGTASAAWFSIGYSFDLSYGVAVAGGSSDFLVTDIENIETGRQDFLLSFVVPSTNGSPVQGGFGAISGNVTAQSPTGVVQLSSVVASNGRAGGAETFFIAYGARGDAVNEVGGGATSQSADAGAPPRIQFSSSYAVPSTTYDGKNFLTAWTGGADSGASGVYAARVSLDGTLIDPTPFQISAQSGQVLLAGGSGGVSLAVQGNLAWLIAEDADAGANFSCPAVGTVGDVGGVDSGPVAAAPDGGVVDADADSRDASADTGPDAGQLPMGADDGGLDTADADNAAVGSAASTDASRDTTAMEAAAATPDDATTVGSNENGPPAALAASSAQGSGGCSMGPVRSSGDAGVLTPLVALPLLRRFRRGVRKPSKQVAGVA